MSNTTKSQVNSNFQIPRRKDKQKGGCKIGSIGMYWDFGFSMELNKYLFSIPQVLYLCCLLSLVAIMFGSGQRAISRGNFFFKLCLAVSSFL